MDQFIRTQMLLGYHKMEKLRQSTVGVFGIGGVGSYVVEALARSGIGRFVLIDKDVIDVTNINRQIHSTMETIGQYKTQAMKKRVLSINPEAEVITHEVFFLPDSPDILPACDYVVDAVDTVTAKIDIILRAQKNGFPVISSMGTGNKINPALLQVADIYDTDICPLAKVMRKELRKRNVKALKVVYSTETPLVSSGGRTPGSTSFVPSSAGLLIASEIIKELAGE